MAILSVAEQICGGKKMLNQDILTKEGEAKGIIFPNIIKTILIIRNC